MIKTVRGPHVNLWRVERLNRRPQPSTIARNSEWPVAYFAESATEALLEALWPLVPSPNLAALVKDEWEERGWNIHQLPSEWLWQRKIVSYKIDPPALFLDLAHTQVNISRRADLLARARFYGGEEETDGTKTLAGIRYSSRFSPDSFLWAVFEDRVTPLPLSEQSLEPNSPLAAEAASKLSVTWS